MKLHEIKNVEDDEDDFPTTKLKDLSKHSYHGRAWVSDKDAEKAYDAVTRGGEGDVLMWDHWVSDTVYEIHVSSTTEAGAKAQLDAIKKAVPRANLSSAYKSGNGMITHRDWKDF